MAVVKNPHAEKIREELGRELERLTHEIHGQMTDALVAGLTQMGRRTVGNVKVGQNKNIDNYIEWCLALGIDWAWLNSQVMLNLTARQENPPRPNPLASNSQEAS